MNTNLVLIDGDHIPYTICHCKKQLNDFGDYLKDDQENFITEKKTLQQVKDQTDNYLFNIFNKLKASEYIGLLTVGRQSFRYNLYPEYKANRLTTTWVKPEHFDACKEYLITNWNFVFNHNIEADDLIGILKNKYPDSIIVSPDKDLLSLKGEHFNPKTFKNISVTKQDAYKAFWKSMLTGDVADNIKGVPGIGNKKSDVVLHSAKLSDNKFSCEVLSEYIDKFGELKGIEEFYKNYKCLRILQDAGEINSSVSLPSTITIDYGKFKETASQNW